MRGGWRRLGRLWSAGGKGRRWSRPKSAVARGGVHYSIRCRKRAVFVAYIPLGVQNRPFNCCCFVFLAQQLKNLPTDSVSVFDKGREHPAIGRCCLVIPSGRSKVLHCFLRLKPMSNRWDAVLVDGHSRCSAQVGQSDECKQQSVFDA